MRFKLRSTTIASCLLATLLTSCGGESSVEFSGNSVEDARAYAEDLYQRFGAPGMAVAVAIDGEIVWSEGFGFADIERQIPATPQTIFRVGSVSKVFTASAVALLHEQGKLDIDAPISEYVSEFPDKGYPITTRQLTGHQGGIRHYKWSEVRPTTHHPDVVEALTFFKDDSLEFIPGTRSAYTSYGWVLVSAVIQSAAKERFQDYMQSQVFEPLGMNSTQPELPDMELPNQATLYDDNLPVAHDNINYILAGGGYLSTVEDLARFGSAFLPGKNFLKPETVEMMFTTQNTSDGIPTRFGLGWWVDKLTTGPKVVFHGGLSTGGSSMIFINPKYRIVVALAANQESGFKASHCQQIACMFLEQADCPGIFGEKKNQALKAVEMPACFAALDNWLDAMKSGDIDQVLRTLSVDFNSDLWNDMSDLETALNDGLEIEEDSDLTIRSKGWNVGDIVRVEGVIFGSGQNATKVIVNIIHEEESWKVISVKAEE